MKNGLLVWNVVLTLVAGYLLVTQFTKKGGDKLANRRSTSDTTMHSPFRIAYFEMDSIENNFEMVKDVKAEISTKEEEYNNKLTQLDWTYRNKYNEYNQNAKTQADVEAAQNALRSLSESLKNQKQDLDQKYQDFVMRNNLKIKSAIETFLQKYNKTKDYTYIVVYEQGLFYYKDTAYNITDDVIKGLNEEYKPVKQATK